MTISLYFGPYNDPGEASTHHWEYPHAPDCHNPALTIARTTNPDQSVTVNVSLAVRSNNTLLPIDADFVKLYAAACGLLNSNDDVNQLASTIITNMGTAPIHTWSAGLGDSMTVPPRSVVQDNFWTPASGPVIWTVPPYASGFIIMAILQCQGQVVQNNYTADPSVAIWLG